jgi:energy-coupling factor transporter transmembrane protein EcfT
MIPIQSDSNGFLFSMSGLTLIILFMVLAVFGWLAIRYRNIRRFEFQMSIFIMVYVLGEILEDYKIPTLPYIGSQIHIVSAVFLATIVWLRLYFVKNSGRKMIDKLESVEENGGNLNGANENTQV